MPLISKLHVVITADGVQRTFDSEGDGWVVVAAFRSWLTSPDCQLPMAEGADAVDVDVAESIVDEAPVPPTSFASPFNAKAEIAKRGAQFNLQSRLMSNAFFTGSGKYDFARLMTCAHDAGAGGHKYTTQDVKQALQQLVLAKKIGVRTVGQQQEWWRLPSNSSSLESAVQS